MVKRWTSSKVLNLEVSLLKDFKKEKSKYFFANLPVEITKHYYQHFGHVKSGLLSTLVTKCKIGNEIVSYGLCMHSHLENNEYFPGLIGFGLRKSHACISDGYLLPFHLLSAGII